MSISWKEGDPLPNADQAEIDLRKFTDYSLQPNNPQNQGLFWFLCGNEVYTDSFFHKIVLKVLPSKHFTIP
jgi:hypothetical protein